VRYPRLTVEQLVGPVRRPTLEEMARGHKHLADMTRRVLATLTPAEEKVLRMRFGVGAGEPLFAENPTVAEIERRAVKHSRVLVWCHTCGTSYDWPWGRCVYRCERCGGHRMRALDPGGRR